MKPSARPTWRRASDWTYHGSSAACASSRAGADHQPRRRLSAVAARPRISATHQLAPADVLSSRSTSGLWSHADHDPQVELGVSAHHHLKEVRSMIARIWRGWTTSQNAEAYERIVSTQVLRRSPPVIYPVITARTCCAVSSPMRWSFPRSCSSTRSTMSVDSPERTTRSPTFHQKHVPCLRDSTNDPHTTKHCSPRTRPANSRERPHLYGNRRRVGVQTRTLAGGGC